MTNDAPDLSMMSISDLVALMGECGRSADPSDRAFAKACRDEIARRKPVVKAVNPSAPAPPGAGPAGE